MDKNQEQRFRECYNDHYSQLVNYTFFMVNDFERAEEIVQDVFVRFHRNFENIGSDAKVVSYLFVACKNSVKNEYRHRSTQKSSYGKLIFVETGKEDFFFEDGQSEENRFIDAEDRSDIINAFEKLKDGDREIIMLKEFMGKSYDEIAELLSVTTTVVRGRLHKARGRLRKIFMQEIEVQ